MESAARGESSNPYGGGKFRKPTTRRNQNTSYDGPATSVRNSGLGGGEDRGGGWLSNLVDPARRLILYCGGRFFGLFFRRRKRPLRLSQRYVIQETKVGHREDTAALAMRNDLIRMEDAVNSTKDAFTDLENILKEKNITRSEADRLITLLRSKATYPSTVDGDQRNEALNECIASPAQLAKAYSRPSEFTPSMRDQAVAEDSVFLNRAPFPSRSPTMSLVPKPSVQRPLENVFLTSRSRGRCAVDSMARPPYSSPQSTVKASPSTWEESLSSGSKQGFQSGLKRRSSVLDNDIGSVGPVRRIRQKSNLSSRSLALPASESPLSVRASGGQNITHLFKDSAGDIAGSRFNHVPSQSSEMATKIFQHIDKMHSTKEKWPSHPDKPLDSAALSRLKQFSAMNKFKKMALTVVAESLSEEEIAGLKEMFKMIDAVNSGQITFEELKEGLKRVGANLKESEILHLVQAVSP